MSSPDARTPSPWKKDGTYIVEPIKKHTSACCRACEAALDVGQLRVGVVFQHRNGFVCINWYHIECYGPHLRSIPLQNLEGYDELDAAQKKLLESYHASASNATDRCLPHPPTCSA